MSREQMPANVKALRVPPHSIDAEQAVLGGLMLNEHAWDRIADKLGEDDFYRGEHRIIFRAIADLKQQNKPFDAVTLGEWFEANNLAEAAGGVSYIVQLANATPSAANIGAYADIVREKSVLRQLIDACGEISAGAFQPHGRSSQEILELAEKKVFAIAEAGARGRRGHVGMDAAVKEVLEILHKLHESKSHVTGLPTGYVDLDELTAGLQPSELVIIAARPSVGKTALAVNIAEHVALAAGKAVAIFSMEMSASQLAFRLISSLGRVNQRHLRTGDIAEEEWPRVSSAMSLLHGAKIFIDDRPALSPIELRSAARRLKRQHDIQLVVIDYLQLMQVPGSRENRATEISEIFSNPVPVTSRLVVDRRSWPSQPIRRPRAWHCPGWMGTLRRARCRRPSR